MLKGPRTSGNGKYLCKMSATNIRVLDERIVFLQRFIPNVFARRLRPSAEVSDYKFTELRQFLLYTGKLLLYNITANPQQYWHFLMYNIVCCLMVDPDKAKTWHYLQAYLMDRVVLGFEEFYAVGFMSYNAHVQQHMPNIALMHGSLDGISAYPFESHLYHIKSSVTSSHNPLVGIVKGVLRRKANLNGVILQPPQATLHTSVPNNVYIDLSSNTVYEALRQVGEEAMMMQYLIIRPFFHEPLCSYHIGCYMVDRTRWCIVYIPKKDVLDCMRRGIRIDLDGFPGPTPLEWQGKAIFMGLLHNEASRLYWIWKNGYVDEEAFVWCFAKYSLTRQNTTDALKLVCFKIWQVNTENALSNAFSGNRILSKFIFVNEIWNLSFSWTCDIQLCIWEMTNWFFFILCINYREMKNSVFVFDQIFVNNNKVTKYLLHGIVNGVGHIRFTLSLRLYACLFGCKYKFQAL